MVLPLTKVAEANNDVNNVGDDDEPENFDELANHTQISNEFARRISYEIHCLLSKRNEMVLLRECYGMGKNDAKHESEDMVKKLKRV